MATTDRAAGPYWVKIDGKWCQAKWCILPEDAFWVEQSWDFSFGDDLVEEVGERVEHSNVSVTELCAALEAALDLIAETLVRGWPMAGDKKMPELRNVLARARGEAVEG